MTAIAGLVLAAASFVTAIRESGAKAGAKAGYEEHSKVIAENQNAVAATHEDLEALRRYVSEHQAAHEVVVVAKPDAGEGHVVVTSVGDAGPPKVAPLKPQAQLRPFEALP